MKNLYLGIILVVSIFLTDVKADHPEHNEVKKMRADTHAPYSIMTDHYHKKNEIMLSYRWMSMQMDGYISGSSDASYTDARTKNKAAEIIWLFPKKWIWT